MMIDQVLCLQANGIRNQQRPLIRARAIACIKLRKVSVLLPVNRKLREKRINICGKNPIGHLFSFLLGNKLTLSGLVQIRLISRWFSLSRYCLAFL